MSRDWTPREQYAADKYFEKSKEMPLRDFRFHFVSETGEEHPMFSGLYERLFQLAPNLTFLFSPLEEFVKKHGENDLMYTFLATIEEELVQIVKDDFEGKSLEKYDAVIVAWYYGELDGHFYYNTFNNGVFEDYLYEKFIEGKYFTHKKLISVSLIHIEVNQHEIWKCECKDGTFYMDAYQDFQVVHWNHPEITPNQEQIKTAKIAIRKKIAKNRQEREKIKMQR